MKHFRRHLPGLGAAAFAVLSMLMLTATSFAAPTRAHSMMAMAGCDDGDSTKASLTCSNDCALVCHAVLLKPVELARLPSWTSATYLETFDTFSSVSIEAEDPPPRPSAGRSSSPNP